MEAIKTETIQFLKDLKKNNDRDWFNKNKDRYVAANENFLGFLGGLINKIAKFDSNVEDLEPKETIFRIYRDTRFSKDKTPYKNHFGSVLKGKDKMCGIAGYYLHFEPGNTFLAGGIHMSEPEQLLGVREAISEKADKFKKIISDKKFTENFEIRGEKLKNVPKGFDKEDPMADYLKYKELVIMHKAPDKELTSDKFADYCTSIYKQMVPFNTFINDATS